MNSIHEDIACNICGSHEYTVKFKPIKTDYDPHQVFSASGSIMGTQQIVRCNSCGLIYVNPRIKTDIVLQAYHTSTDELYVSQAEAREKTFKKYLSLVEQYAGKKGAILDVGAAAGFFLKVAKDAGWDVYGVELSQWLSDYGNKNFNLSVHSGTVRDAHFPDNFFDAVTIWDVLEHVPDPSADVAEIYRILKPGGIFIVNYPDIGTLMAKIAGSKWWFLLSGHLFYFDKNSIRTILEKNKFKILKTKMHFQSMELGHLAKMLGLYNKLMSNVSLRLFSLLHIDAWSIQYYASQTNVIAQKP